MKTPRFFCDNCGEEVERDHNACPRCGRFFSSIRCPKCGFSGEDKLFANGCPSCGYSAVKSPQIRRKKPPRPPKKKKPKSDFVPFWVYIVSFFVMLIVMAIILMVIL